MLMGTKGRLFWACDVCQQEVQDLRWVVRTDIGPTPCHLVHDDCLQGLLGTLVASHDGWWRSASLGSPQSGAEKLADLAIKSLLIASGRLTPGRELVFPPAGGTKGS